MGSRDKDQSPPHQPLLSSLVIRPADSGGGGGSDYETGEVRLDLSPHYRSDRYSDRPGYKMRTGSGSPVRRRDRYSPDFDRPAGMPRGRGGRFREYFQPYGRGRGRGGRFMGRGSGGPRFGFGTFRGRGTMTSNSNVCPRDGDWICPDPTCNNLNFARREHCNNCSKFRYAPIRHPQRGRYFSHPPPYYGPSRRFPRPPLDRSPRRPINGYRSSPPHSWTREDPREYPKYEEERIPAQSFRRERSSDHPEDDFRERRPISPDMALRDRGYERRQLSPERSLSPLPPRSIGRYDERERSRHDERERSRHDERERSRSPIRGRMYVERGRDERRVVVRDQADDAY